MFESVSAATGLSPLETLILRTHLPSFLCLCDAYVSMVAGDGQSAYAAAEDLSRWSTEEGQQLAWDIMTGLGLRDGTQVHPYGPDA